MNRPINFKGAFRTDETTRRLYATDASAYRELPLAVALPLDTQDIIALVRDANEKGYSLIPRAAGTSLAGQVVGAGVIVDISRHMDRVLEINPEAGWVKVQPGIIRDDLNRILQPFGYFFAPETATANRAMIGGMIGNNSCGANSLVYGSTREHLLAVKTVLADGSEAEFGALDNHGFAARCNGHDVSGELHNQIYYTIRHLLRDKANQISIRNGYPKPDIPRRNTGYALDMLLRQQPFDEDSDEPFNFCSLIAGSEGTLAIVTEATLRLTPLPPPHKKLVCIHCESIDEALRANLVALRHRPSACELMDHYILEATERNRMYQEYRFFVEGRPHAILVVELARESVQQLDPDTALLIRELKAAGYGYAFPVVEGDDIPRVWGLRKAGLGLLSNVPGDAKPAPVIEDTAVDVRELPEYIAEFNRILEQHGLYSVHYAHAGSGELHLRPILNLKTAEGQSQFRVIAEEIARLVKKYNGSLSGEHGDGRLRGEFIPQMLGQHNYRLCCEIKSAWDPRGIFNPGKIIDSPPMDTSLRYDPGQHTPEFETKFDFTENQGIVRAAEQCNGSGDCRKTALSGGTMCPSYMATRDERDTTRARANILREMLTRSDRENPFDSPEIKEVLDLCLSCKGCKSECPSNVDMAKLKAEWQHQYYQVNGIPFRSRLIGSFASMMRLAMLFPWAYRLAFGIPGLSFLTQSLIGFAPGRSMPALPRTSLRKWLKKEYRPQERKQAVYFFVDEFTDFQDAAIGRKAVRLLDRLGYEVRVLPHGESGRSYLSKGLLDEAGRLAAANVRLFHEFVSEETPLVGLEPSAILTFRDEYISLLRGEDQVRARALSKNVYTIEEFISQEISKGNISEDMFEYRKQHILLHGHCHQKALSSVTPTRKMLGFLPGRKVEMIPSGCCGMAGSFGYEKEHFDLSMRIGELVLFPAIRAKTNDVTIAAPGTSCRHQIKDGTGRIAMHPVEICYEALRNG